MLGFSGYYATLQAVYEASTNENNTATESFVISEIDSLRRVSPAPAPPRVHSYRTLNTLSTLRERQGNFSSAHPYAPSTRQAWSIEIPHTALSSSRSSSMDIVISFSRFETERVFDRVKVFEHSDGTGAMIAVLHGGKTPVERLC